MQRGETDLMTPNGVAASIPQVSQWFRLTPVYGESSPASMNSGGGGNAHPSHPHGGGGGMHAPSKLSFGGGMKHDDDDDMGEMDVGERRHRRHMPDADDDNDDDKGDDDEMPAKGAMVKRRHRRHKEDDDDDEMNGNGDDDQMDAKAGMGERRRKKMMPDDDDDDDMNGKDGEGDQMGFQAFLDNNVTCAIIRPLRLEPPDGRQSWHGRATAAASVRPHALAQLDAIRTSASTGTRAR